MENRDRMEMDGTVDVAIKDKFHVNISTNETPNIVLCTLSGKIRQNSIRILIADRVRIEVSPYDLTKGRIIYRYKGNERSISEDDE